MSVRKELSIIYLQLKYYTAYFTGQTEYKQKTRMSILAQS